MGKPKDAKQDGASDELRTPSVSTLADGTVCIGEGCLVLKIKPGSDEIDIDLSKCDEIAKSAVVKAVGVEGRATRYKVNEKQP
jgi:hypothetical protein